MAKDIVIIPASGRIEFSGSSTVATNHTILTTDSSSVELSGSGNTSLNVLGEITSSGNIFAKGTQHKFQMHDGDPDKGFEIKLPQYTTPALRVYAEDGNYTALKLFEEGGATNDDYFWIATYSDGSTSFYTEDAGGAAADMSFTPDGKFLVANVPTKFAGNITASKNYSGSATSNIKTNTLTLAGNTSNTPVLSLMKDGATSASFGIAGGSNYTSELKMNSQDIYLKGADGVANWITGSLYLGKKYVYPEPSGKQLEVEGDISASGDLYIDGNLILGDSTSADDHIISGSAHFRGAAAINDIAYKMENSTGGGGGVTLELIAHSGQQKEVLRVTNAGTKEAIVAEGDISASGDYYVQNTNKIHFADYAHTDSEFTIFKTANDHTILKDTGGTGTSINITTTRMSGQRFGIHIAGGDNSSSGGVFIGGSSTASDLTASNAAKTLTVDGDISASGDFLGKSTSTGSFGHLIVNSGDGIGKVQDGGGELHLVSDDLQFHGESTKFVYGGAEVINIDVTPSAIDFTTTKNIEFSKAISATHITASNNLKVAGNILANGNIIGDNSTDISGIDSITANSLNVTHFTSSFITSSTIVTEGSNTFGDTSADTHTFNGNITASGHISGSSTSAFSGQDGIFIRELRVGGADSLGGHGVVVSGQISSSGFISTKSHITASGNISSSGTIKGTTFFVNGQINTTDGRLYENGSIPLVIGNSPTAINLANAPTNFAGNVTASGTISGSTEVKVSNLRIDANQFIYYDESNNFGWRVYETPANGRIMMNKIGGVGGLMSMSGSSGGRAYVAIDNGTTGVFPVEGLTINAHLSASGQITAGHIADSNGNSINTFGGFNSFNNGADIVSGSMVRVGAAGFGSASLELYSSNKGWTFKTSKNHSDFTAAGSLRILSNRTTDVMAMTLAGNVGIGNTAPDKELVVAGEISSSNAISVANTEVVSGSGEILNRFQLSYDYNGRVTSANKWMTKSDRGGFANYSLQLATSNPSGTAVTYLAAARYSSYTAPRACKLIRMQSIMLNYTNDDDIKIGVYKGTAVNDSNSTITITQIGSDIGGSMDEDKTYMNQTDFSSGNDLAAGDFLLFTIHSTSVSSTSYPRFSLNLELQYT